MHYEHRQPDSPEGRLSAGPPSGSIGSETETTIQSPAFRSAEEAVDIGRRDFREVLRTANLRALVRYIEDGKTNLDEIVQIPETWKLRFRAPEFRSSTYTWRNPKIHLLTAGSAAAMALDELLRRLTEEDGLRPQQ
jgi:hypothetical protein